MGITFCHKEIALKILRYLDEHPDARDTIEGITAWWLLEQQIREEKDKVMETLRDLVDQGMLVRHRRKHADELFSVNREKRELIKSLLAEPDRARTAKAYHGSKRPGEEHRQ